MATVTKRNNTYKITVSCGYNMNGKQIRRIMTWKPLPNMTPKQEEKELQRQTVMFEEKCRSGQILDSSIRFSEFAELWFNDRKDDLRPKTLSRYESMLPRINTAIGHMKLDKIQPQHLRAFYKNLSESGVRNDIKYRCKIDLLEHLNKNNMTKTKFSKISCVPVSSINSIINGNNVSFKTAENITKELKQLFNNIFDIANENKTLSSKTILHHHRLISSILSTAVEWQVIFSNPCERTKPPKVENKEPKFLDENQVENLLSLLELEDMQNRTMIRLLLYTGFRRGELLGLEWSDIDFKNNTIQIKRSSLYLPEKGVFEDTTKNTSSQRVIKLPQIAMDDLKKFKASQAEQHLLMGDRWKDSSRLFTTKDGKPLHPDTLSKWFNKFIKTNDLPKVTIHGLRHTNATLQIAGGVPITTVAKRLGHANTVTTGKIYAHAIKSADEAAADIIDDFLRPKNKTG